MTLKTREGTESQDFLGAHVMYHHLPCKQVEALRFKNLTY